jgi:hypothetical protein
MKCFYFTINIMSMGLCLTSWVNFEFLFNQRAVQHLMHNSSSSTGRESSIEEVVNSSNSCERQLTDQILLKELIWTCHAPTYGYSRRATLENLRIPYTTGHEDL